MRIKNVLLDNDLMLAPMAGFTDSVYRLIVKEHGCALVCSEMISAKGLVNSDSKSLSLLTTRPMEHPISIQIFGSEPDIMAHAAQIVEANGADMVDINMGCPTPKIVKNGDGSALMKKPELAADIVGKIVAAVNIPVTAKIRKGWDETSVNAMEFSKGLCDAGVSAIAVHGRTRSQFYSGEADWDIIGEIVESLDVPVIGNGDITCPEDALKMKEHTGCNGLMIGRAARGNPWIFSRTLKYLQDGCIPPAPTVKDRIDAAIRHLSMLVETKGERTAVKQMRTHAMHYIKGLPQAAKCRERIVRSNSFDQMVSVLQEL